MTDSIAKIVFDYNNEMQEIGQITSKTPVLPPGIVGKMMTCQAHGRPYQNGIIFEDGSELTVSFGGDFYWSEAGEWQPSDPETFKVKLGGS